MMTALLVGLVVGFILAMPPGPIAMACIHQALAGQAREGVGHAVGAHVMYALGFGVGGALWFVLLLRTLTHLRAKISPTVIPMMYRVAGGVLLLFAGMLTYHMVTTTAWSRLPGW